MSGKLTEKQEAFARFVAEGDTYSAAYRKAYDAENMSNEVIWKEASILMADRKVSVRVMELQEKAQERTLYTIEKAMEELEELREKAALDGQFAPAVSAVEKKIKLNGLFDKDNAQKGPSVIIVGKEADL